MRRFVLALAVMSVLTAPADAQEQSGKHGASGTPSAPAPDGPKYRLFVEDGQLASHGFCVFVTPDVPSDADVRLELNRHHVVTTRAAAEGTSWTPLVTAREQTRVVKDGGHAVAATGTLLVFDVPSGYFDLRYGDSVSFLARGSVRVLPIVTWTKDATTRTVVAAGDVYLANIKWVWIWTLCVMTLLIGGIAWIARRAKGSAIGFLLGPDGKMALSHVQAALWTVAIGAVLLSYGFSRAEVPTVPGSLVALMGMSFVTNGFARIRAGRSPAAAPGSRKAWRVSDMLVAPDGDPGAGAVTLERAQMLFWTLALAGLFVAKSILEGTMWDVPWELVALTGFSQAAYLSAKGKKANATVSGGAPIKDASGAGGIAAKEQGAGGSAGGAKVPTP